MPEIQGFKKVKKIVFYIFVATSLVIIGYFNFPWSSASGDISSKSNSGNNGQVENTNTKSMQDEFQGDKELSSGQEPSTKPLNEVMKENTDKNTMNQNKSTEPLKIAAEGLLIQKKDVTRVATFYPYQAGGQYMEVLAVKAGDGSIRTALNTCQVCFDSGRGYYQQDGDYLICQNCQNKFHIDQVGLVKGGCNPVAIMEENKQDTGPSILIPKSYLDSQSHYFSKWKS